MMMMMMGVVRAWTGAGARGTGLRCEGEMTDQLAGAGAGLATRLDLT